MKRYFFLSLFFSICSISHSILGMSRRRTANATEKSGYSEKTYPLFDFYESFRLQSNKDNYPAWPNSLALAMQQKLNEIEDEKQAKIQEEKIKIENNKKLAEEKLIELARQKELKNIEIQNGINNGTLIFVHSSEKHKKESKIYRDPEYETLQDQHRKTMRVKKRAAKNIEKKQAENKKKQREREEHDKQLPLMPLPLWTEEEMCSKQPQNNLFKEINSFDQKIGKGLEVLQQTLDDLPPVGKGLDAIQKTFDSLPIDAYKQIMREQGEEVLKGRRNLSLEGLNTVDNILLARKVGGAIVTKCEIL